MNSTRFFVQLWLLLFIGQHRAHMIEGELQVVFEEAKGYRGIPEPLPRKGTFIFLTLSGQ
jgi:hypothetical protein